LFTEPLPLGLYIHIPWCIRKCPYCDFNSHTTQNNRLPEREYIDALLADLAQDLPLPDERKVDTIFIGGGTPSLFAPESIERLLTGLAQHIMVADDAEITMEANPGAVEAGKFAEFRAAGINRLSIGVQSFQDDALNRLGRIHGKKDAFLAVEQAHEAGLENFNLDLMFGLPGQTLEYARKDLMNAVSLEPAHISWYQLTLEPNTHFYHAPPANIPADEDLWKIQQQGQRYLAEQEFLQYEISAYTRTQSCKHNLNYWQFGDYLGIGAGAHAKITDSTKASVIRTAKIKHPRDYIAHKNTAARISKTLPLSTQDLSLEFMMNTLRLNEGFEPVLFNQRTGLSLESIDALLTQAADKDLLDVNNDRIQATALGRRFLNDLLNIFMFDGVAEASLSIHQR